MPTHNEPELRDTNRKSTKSTHRRALSAATSASPASWSFLPRWPSSWRLSELLCYGIGKVINAHMNKEDGPNSKWTKTVDVRQLGNMPSSPELQNKMAEITQTFPTPRVQTDDGDQDVADLHAREDLLLEYYSWVESVAGEGENSHRAGHGADCAAGTARGAGGRNSAADDGRQRAHGDRAADRRIRAYCL